MPNDTDPTAVPPTTRERIVAAASDLLREHGAAGVTTRAVADRAAVQAPTIYRQFGDKDGLLDAVAEHAMATYGAAKAATAEAARRGAVDPVDDLRAGWEATIAFGLDNPDLFVIMSDPRRGQGSPAVAAGLRVLRGRLRRVAAVGRLRVREDEAVALLHAAGTGAVLTILGMPEEDRDTRVADLAYAAISTQLLTPTDPDASDAPRGARRSAALTLRAEADALEVLSPAERALFSEWLDRVADRG